MKINQNKKIISISVSLIAIISIFILFYIIYPFFIKIPLIKTKGENTNIKGIDSSPTSPLVNVDGDIKIINTNPSQQSSIKENANEINVKLEVLNKNYKLSIPKNSSVYDFMGFLQEKNKDFSFHSKEYPSLGSFITEINGIKRTPGKYWIYYVNNIEASVGVSNYILKDGDSILWKQE